MEVGRGESLLFLNFNNVKNKTKSKENVMLSFFLDVVSLLVDEMEMKLTGLDNNTLNYLDGD